MYSLPQSVIDRARQINEERWIERYAQIERIERACDDLLERARADRDRIERGLGAECWEKRADAIEAVIGDFLATDRSQGELRGIRVCARLDLIDFLNRLAVE
jgi:hypothetical protein